MLGLLLLEHIRVTPVKMTSVGNNKSTILIIPSVKELTNANVTKNTMPGINSASPLDELILITSTLFTRTYCSSI
jgi:hypothetical protein